jgi:hypothetical protein
VYFRMRRRGIEIEQGLDVAAHDFSPQRKAYAVSGRPKDERPMQNPTGWTILS